MLQEDTCKAPGQQVDMYRLPKTAQGTPGFLETVGRGAHTWGWDEETAWRGAGVAGAMKNNSTIPTTENRQMNEMIHVAENALKHVLSLNPE